eukprot:scaffold44233_cov62-Phaeocystis_antarctica.AAC.2
MASSVEPSIRGVRVLLELPDVVRLALHQLNRREGGGRVGWRDAGGEDEARARVFEVHECRVGRDEAATRRQRLGESPHPHVDVIGREVKVRAGAAAVGPNRARRTRRERQGRPAPRGGRGGPAPRRRRRAAAPSGGRRPARARQRRRVLAERLLQLVAQLYRAQRVEPRLQQRRVRIDRAARRARRQRQHRLERHRRRLHRHVAYSSCRLLHGCRGTDTPSPGPGRCSPPRAVVLLQGRRQRYIERLRRRVVHELESRGFERDARRAALYLP